LLAGQPLAPLAAASGRCGSLCPFVLDADFATGG
jgi:hypothetical protein